MKTRNMMATNSLHKILITPEQTTLVLVDYQMVFESCFEYGEIKLVEFGILSLVEAAKEIGIPVIASVVETNLIGSKLSFKLDKTTSKSSRFSRGGLNPWDDSDFVNAVNFAGRPRLLLAGLSVETSLSFTALCALERGFDVYVVKDACLGHSPESIAITFDRLTQAGVVPVSWRQILLEWNQGNVNAKQLRRILKPRGMHRHRDRFPENEK